MGGKWGKLIFDIEQVSHAQRRLRIGCENAGLYWVIIFYDPTSPEMTHDFISALVDELEDYVGYDVTKHARTELSTCRTAQWVAQFIEHGASKRPQFDHPLGDPMIQNGERCF